MSARASLSVSRFSARTRATGSPQCRTFLRAQDRLILVHDPLPVRAGNVLSGQDGKDSRAGPRQRKRRYSEYPAMGDPGSFHPGPQQVLRVVVRGEFLLARNLGPGVNARNRAAYCKHLSPQETLPSDWLNGFPFR